jgi:hypothetical protein
MVGSIYAHSDSSSDAKRDVALARVNACQEETKVSARQCKKLKQSLDTLIGAYREGDKSVLAALFRFPYLVDFYGEALLSDTDGFLSALAKLPKKDEESVEFGIAGGAWYLLPRVRFQALRAQLAGVSPASPVKEIAQSCLTRLETNNPVYFVDYFPPRTFNGPAAKFQLYWYSRAMYALGENPLWLRTDGNSTYRFTYLGSFTGSRVATLSISPDGTGMLQVKVMDAKHESTPLEISKAVSQDEVARFSAQLDAAHFCDLPTESPRRGLDGAQWILEGARNDRYHIAVRWSPDFRPRSPQENAFADAARMLFKLAGQAVPQ